MNKLFINVPEEMARKIGFYIIKDNKFYVSVINYLTEILPKPFNFMEDFTVESGIYIRISTNEILNTVETLLHISKKIHINNNEITFILSNNSIISNLE